MRVIIQRVSRASVEVEQRIVGEISQGILLLLGVEKNDTEEDAEKLIKKIINLRIFTDSSGKMNLSLLDISGELLVISQFTLYGDCRKGRRPSFSKAAGAELGKELYNYFLYKARSAVEVVEAGVFGADMQVSLVNDGPVTFVIDSN